MVDGEAEIDKLLMMHMSKHHHEDEVPYTSCQEASGETDSHCAEKVSKRKDSNRKKRPAKTRVMSLALEVGQISD